MSRTLQARTAYPWWYSVWLFPDIKVWMFKTLFGIRA